MTFPVRCQMLKNSMTSNEVQPVSQNALHTAHLPAISTLSTETVLNRLQSRSTGLLQNEIEHRLLRHGRNSIVLRTTVPFWHYVQSNYLHSMAILLWCAGALAFFAKMPQLAIAIWLVNIINGSFSLWQEYRAEKATEALNLLLPETVPVLRANQRVEVPVEEIVPGDIILLTEGQKIPADARLIEGASLSVDQSSLTGEAHAIKKSPKPIAVGNGQNHTADECQRINIANLLFASTSVLSGHGIAVVYGTGTATEFGRIAKLTQTLPEAQSPLQIEMKRVTEVVSALALGIGISVFLLATLISRVPVEQALPFAIGMIVAFVPEGMVPTVTLALALAVQRMAKKHALVKRLSSVETLGCTTVICTDKTGTLTENKMTVVRMLAGDTMYSVKRTGKLSTIESLHNSHDDKRAGIWELLRSGAFCNNGILDLVDGEIQKKHGDPTEVALLEVAAKYRPKMLDDRAQMPRLHELVFDSRRKRMSTIHQINNDQTVMFTKGSPISVLDRCSRILIDSEEISLTEEQRKQIVKIIDGYATDGLRVLAAAQRTLLNRDLQVFKEHGSEDVECDLTFLGLFALEDPPRPEVPDAIAKCEKAGIQVVMITGDYEVTATAIARQIGILKGEKAHVFTGSELDRITDQELVELLREDLIFARVNPEHKLRIVEAFQRCGNVVAVTGDGVNDAPALKKADIGVAMGIVGTDVAREAADVVLLDDNFASVVNAIEEGRAIYENIKKFAMYVFASNMAEAVPFAVMLFSFGLIPLPLTIMQVLSIDLGTDMVPALGLGVDRPPTKLMSKKPRNKNQPLLSPRLLTRALLWYGGIEAMLGMSGYFYINWQYGWPQVALAPTGSDVWRLATSMTLACIVGGQIGSVFCCRTENSSILSRNIFSNRLILGGVLFEILLLICMTNLPLFQSIFNTAPLDWNQWLLVLACPFVVITLDEARKAVLRMSLKKQQQQHLLHSHDSAKPQFRELSLDS